MSREAWEAACALAARSAAVDTIFDVGSSHGAAARVFRRHFARAAIHCFEPNPDALRQLGEALAGDTLSRIHTIALGAVCGSASFYKGISDSTSSLYPRNTSGRRYFRSDLRMKATIDVEAVTLDAFCTKQNINRIALMKIDTQGAELQILMGGHQLLTRNAIGVILTEFFLVPHYEGAPLLHELYSYLAGFGYTAFDLFRGAVATNGQLRYGDAIFVSAPFREQVLDLAPAEP